MIPIGDEDIPGSRLQVINILLIIVNVLVFVYMFTLDQASLHAFLERFAVVPAEIMRGENLESLVTAMFMHAGPLHLIGNMVFLWIFGDNIEAVLGHVGYLLFYLLGGLAGSALHIAFAADSTVPSLGASGAIAAVLGAYLVMFPRSRVRVLLILGFFITVTRITAFVFLIIWGLMQLFSGIAALSAEAAEAGVAYWAHIGGFVLGLAGGAIFRGEAVRLKRQGSRSI